MGDSFYCKNCNSCGEEGCCSPLNCKFNGGELLRILFKRFEVWLSYVYGYMQFIKLF